MCKRVFLFLWLGVAVSSAARAEGPGGAIVFADVTAQAGLVDPLAGLMGHGGAWGDFDGDGRIDLYVGGFCDRPAAEYAPAAGPVRNRLFRNAGGGRFEPAGQEAVEMLGRTSGAVFADLDNNGTLELYVANNAQARPSAKASEPQRSAQGLHSRLFRNDKGTFVDVSAASGACPDTLHKARNVCPLDYDGDGLLDLMVVEDKFTPRPRTALFRNKGGLVFEDVTAAAGLPQDLHALGLAVADLNGDDRPDLFVPHSNRLFVSVPGGTFREAEGLRELFAWKPVDAEDWPCGAAFADLNRDGRLDLVLSIHHKQARNRVYLNEGLKDGLPQFRDVTEAAGLATPVPARCPHVECQDFDNDGLPDLYVSAGWLEGDKATPLIYRNVGLRDGVPRFEPPRPVAAPMVYFPAGPSGDFDNDGKLDLFLINWFQGNRCRLLQNRSLRQLWLRVQAVGANRKDAPAAGKTNRMGIGAKVWVYAGGSRQDPKRLLGYQEVATGYGYASGQPATCHFGLGAMPSVDVVVRFPSGKTVSIGSMPAEQLFIAEEPE